MKKNRIVVLSAILLGVFALSGCELWKAAKEITKNVWTKKTVQSKSVSSDDDSGKTFDVDVYMYYTDEAKKVNGISLGKGLNVLLETDANNAEFFGRSLASYTVFTFAPGETIEKDDEGSGKKSFKVTDDAWAAAYGLGLVEKNKEPKCLSNRDYEELSDILDPDSWKEYMAEKLIELLLG